MCQTQLYVQDIVHRYLSKSTKIHFLKFNSFPCKLILISDQSAHSPSTGMHCNSFRILQSRHNVSPGFVCNSKSHHGLVGACDPEQDIGGPVISHCINCSHSVSSQNLLDCEQMTTINYVTY